jgi:hypothetical protein
MAANFLCKGVSAAQCDINWFTYGLARLLAQERDEVVLVLLEEADQLSEELLALLGRCGLPRGEGLLRSSDGIVQVLGAGDGDIPQLLASGGVDTVVDLVRATVLAVDDVVELLEIEGRDLSRRHNCGVWRVEGN